MKIIIAGGRDFNDYKFLKESVLSFIGDYAGEIIVVCGLAKGADALGKQLQEEMGWEIQEFPADWDKFHKAAGYIRNTEMADFATHCVCFWDEKSKGTKHMIDLATKKELLLKVFIHKPIIVKKRIYKNATLKRIQEKYLTKQQ